MKNTIEISNRFLVSIGVVGIALISCIYLLNNFDSKQKHLVLDQYFTSLSQSASVAELKDELAKPDSLDKARLNDIRSYLKLIKTENTGFFMVSVLIHEDSLFITIPSYSVGGNHPGYTSSKRINQKKLDQLKSLEQGNASNDNNLINSQNNRGGKQFLFPLDINSDKKTYLDIMFREKS